MDCHRHTAATHGFTIIELVVVIVLLSILAATVLPRFMSADREAHAAIASSTLGAFLSSATLLHGEWLASGGRASSLVVDGQTVDFSADGWPTAAAPGAAGCSTFWTSVLRTDQTVVPFNAALPAERWATARAGAYCVFYYQGGEPFSISRTPLFVFLPIDVPPNYQAGDVIALNVD